MASLGDITATLKADTAQFERGLKTAGERLNNVTASVKRLGGFLEAYLGVQFVRQTVGHLVDVTKEAELSEARLEAILKATGNAAGFTADQLNRLADEMAGATLFDDEAIRNAEAELLRFGNVQGEVFTRGLHLAADFATLMGTDLSAAITSVGRALNDPTQGLVGLSRAGVNFLDVQKKQIEELWNLGRVAEAQEIILKKLSETVGGTAEAANKGLTGSIKAAKMAYDNFLESLGKTEGFSQPVRDLLGFITNFFKARELTDSPIEDLAISLDKLEQKIFDIKDALKTGVGVRELAREFDVEVFDSTAEGFERMKLALIGILMANESTAASMRRRLKAHQEERVELDATGVALRRYRVGLEDVTRATAKLGNAIADSQRHMGGLTIAQEAYAKKVANEWDKTVYGSAKKALDNVEAVVRKHIKNVTGLFPEQFDEYKRTLEQMNKEAEEQLIDLEELWKDAARGIARAFAESLFRGLDGENIFERLFSLLKRVLERVLEELLVGALSKIIKKIGSLIGDAASGGGVSVPGGGRVGLTVGVPGLGVPAGFGGYLPPGYKPYTGPAPTRVSTIDVSGMPPAMNPLAAARDSQWVAFLSESMRAVKERGGRG